MYMYNRDNHVLIMAVSIHHVQWPMTLCKFIYICIIGHPGLIQCHDNVIVLVISILISIYTVISGIVGGLVPSATVRSKLTTSKLTKLS